MSPSKKKQSTKKEDKKSMAKTIRKWEGIAMLALTALGSGLGEGAVHAFQHPREVPSASAPLSPNKQTEKLNYAAPQQKDQPTGDEPKQHLKFIYTNNRGEAQTFHTVASVQSLGNATLRWAANSAAVQPQSKQEADDSLTIKAQLHPSAPIITLNIPKKEIADQIATLGATSGSAEDFASVRHIVISPYLNPEKPSKA